MERTLFTSDHALFRDIFRHFVEKEIAPFNEEWERAGLVPRELWLKAGGQGFLGYNVPEEYGGVGLDDYCYSAIMVEELVRVGAMSVNIGIGLHNDIIIPYLLDYATSSQ